MQTQLSAIYSDNEPCKASRLEQAGAVAWHMAVETAQAPPCLHDMNAMSLEHRHDGVVKGA